jgi:drug/metabolite transporter (DMT)-like permease
MATVAGMRDRYSAIQVMVLGIVLGAVGAVIAYAITVSDRNIDVHTLGVTVLVVGIAVFAVGVLAAILSVMRRPTVYDEYPPDRY